MRFLLSCLAAVGLGVSIAGADCVGDYDGDGTVDVQDVLEVIANWEDPYTVSDVLTAIGNWGCSLDHASVGLFSSGTNYFELDMVSGAELKFHFGSQMSNWGAASIAIAGDFDGDGADTVCMVDMDARSFLIADENDSDEFEVLGTEIVLTDVPPTGPGGDGAPTQWPVAGDWDGDGVDGIGLFIIEDNTFYLRDTLTTGPAEYTVVLDSNLGYPAEAYAIAGDFDGDGDDEPGLHSSGVAYLATGVDDPTIAASFPVPGIGVTVGDFTGTGVDTLAGFDVATNDFTVLLSNAGGASTWAMQFGHAEPGFWSWQPIAGSWQVPANPVASQGYEWPVDEPGDNGVDPVALESGLAGLAAIENVQAVLVARHGELVAERYHHGYDRHIAQNVKSVSKSVLSAIFGAAFDDGTIGLGDTVSSHIPAYFAGLSEAKQAITIQDIMTMRGGLFAGPTTQEYNGALRSSPDYTAFVVTRKLVSTPGTTYVYSTGLTHLGSAMLTEAVGASTREFGREHLFEPMGISVPRWDGSPEGYDFGGAEMWMRPRDLARFGQVFLDGGVADGEQVLSPVWVAESANPWVPEAGGRTYGLWWRERPWDNYPANDSYFGWGWGGQFVFIFPTMDLVVVVNSKWQVDGNVSGATANAIFAAVDAGILTAVGD